MFQKLLAATIVVALICTMVVCAFAEKPENHSPVDLPTELEPSDEDSAVWTEAQCKTHEIAELARELGLEETNPIILEASRIWWSDCGADKLSIDTSIENHYGLDTYWTEADAEMLAKLIYTEAHGIPSKMEKAAVVWCVLNRVDESDSSISAITTAPNQFAYSPYSPTTYLGEDFSELAMDVLARWSLEHEGRTDVGRVLPADFRWFGGDGAHNHFRNQYIGGTRWDWSLPDPYLEDDLNG